MVLAIVLGLVFILLAWILTAPFSLIVDTYVNEYRIRWWGIGSAEVLFVPDDIVLHLQIGPWGKNFHPLRPSPGKAEKKAKASSKKPGRRAPFHKIRRILKTFTVQEFKLELDSGNYVWNAWLFPIVHSLKPLRHRVLVNFLGRNECRLVVKNQLWKIARAYLW